MSGAAANATPENVDAARLELERLNAYQARRKGWDGAAPQAELLRDSTELHGRVIQSLVRADPIAAQAY
jgi:hypothetical protein